MAIEETGSFVSDLNASASANKPTDNPGKRADGAGEIRKLKAILKNSFSNIFGTVTVSQTELNLLSGLTGNVQGQINDRFRANDLLATYQPVAPLGWTRHTDSAFDNRMMRIVTQSAPGATGGQHTPILMNVVPNHNHVVGATIPSPVNHTHGPVGIWARKPGQGNAVINTSPGNLDITTNIEPAGFAALSFSTTTQGNSGALNWAPRYMDWMIIKKN